MRGKHRATTWAEVEALPRGAQEALLAAFVLWVETRFAIDLAHYWPVTDRQLPTVRSPHGFAVRRASGWPPCWLEHGWVRDCLLTAYVWDQEIATGKGNGAGAERAGYQKHVRDVVVAEVQHVAQMCRPGHVDPSERPADAEPWQPTPPPLRHQPTVGAMPLGWRVFYPVHDGGHELDQ